jgi:hypothetical protein
MVGFLFLLLNYQRTYGRQNTIKRAMVWATIMMLIPLTTTHNRCDDYNLALDIDSPKSGESAPC